MASALRRFLAPLAVTTVAAAAVVILWQALRYDHESKVAQVTAAASYATRSELARQLIVQFTAFRELSRVLAESERERRGQRAMASAIPLTLFAGVDVIAWNEQGGRRFLTDGSNADLEGLPRAEQWAGLGELFPTEQPARAMIVGPKLDPEGHAIFTFVVPVRQGGRDATLLGVIDANDALGSFLLDEDPGFDIRVTCCNGMVLYSRSETPPKVPASWVVDGLIAPEPGILWRVAHRPTAELADDLTPWATNAVLAVGLAMAFALGAFVYQSRRADDRAQAASEAEQRVTTLNRNLEQEVQRRTQDLNEVLADLNTINLSVSHDLRSPLNAISLLTHQLKLDGDRDDDERDLLDRMSATVKRAAAIMDRLFGFSRATSFEYTIEEVDMEALAEQVVEELTSDRPAVEIGVAELPDAQADATMVHSLLTNLVGNALKYAGDADDARVEIGYEHIDSECVYFVRDNGPGFDAEMTGELFKPMKRTAGAKKKADGLGLGLTIAARIAKRHGGRIWAEAAPDAGATFYFTLAPRSG
jgi:signal transduction histidine kinase